MGIYRWMYHASFLVTAVIFTLTVIPCCSTENSHHLQQVPNEVHVYDIKGAGDEHKIVDSPVLLRLKRSRRVSRPNSDRDSADIFAGFGSDRHSGRSHQRASRPERRQRPERRPERRRGHRHRKHRHRHAGRPRPTLPTAYPRTEPSTEPPQPKSGVKNAHYNREDGGQSVLRSHHIDVDPYHIPTGQAIRLNGSPKHTDGRVEIYQNGRWGVICDDGWDLNDANIACRQLGFTNGALSAVGGSRFGVGAFTHRDFLMNRVRCQGFESSIQQCMHSTEHSCTASEIASVTCIPNQGCENGWVGGNGLCYRLLHQMTSFANAASKCQQLDAHLVTIESQTESDFVNNWLLTATNEPYLWTAGRRIELNDHQYWIWHGTLYRIGFTKWFPGWPPSGVSRQPSGHPGQDCVTLARTYYDAAHRVADVGYYFWNDAPCTVNLPYACEKVAKFTEDCYNGTGDDYRGNVFRTERGTLCQKWTASPKVNPTTHPNKDLGDHNACRNPDSDLRPWCWIDVAVGRFGYCALQQCSGITAPTVPDHTPPPQNNATTAPDNVLITTPPPNPPQAHSTSDMPRPVSDDCSEGEVRCHSSDSRFCIPTRWRCDGEEDCPSGEDEQLCESHLNDFRKVANHYLSIPINTTYPIHKESHLFVSPERCAEICLSAKHFVCRSFNYRRSGIVARCTIFNITGSHIGSMEADENHDYYEHTLQTVNCTLDLFLCTNNRCIQKDKVCDGYDDCNDFSDETTCEPDVSHEVEVRLGGGTHENEGRVEVKYHGEWGVVCDDKWDVTDAEVVCKQLGYQGAIAATLRSEYGAGNGNVLLDEVQCNGNESSIEQCKHAPWRQHDCHSFEIAGVVCMVGKVCDLSTEYECEDNGRCVPLTSLCNDKNDCRDGSDEVHCLESDVKVSLVGGRTPHEGRVEVTINGVKGTVCDDSWDNQDAAVVCRMLGYSGAAVATGGGHFAAGSGPIWFDNMRCGGGEMSLVRCRYSGLAKHDCDHTEDAGVVCDATAPAATRASFTPGRPIQCGRREIAQPLSRIVGGHTARYGAYPWQAGVSRWVKSTSEFTHWCGGTIIGERWILSAAHCFINKRKQDLKIRVGDHDQTKLDRHEQEFEIEEIINHADYSSTPHLESGSDSYQPPSLAFEHDSLLDSFLSMLLGGRSRPTMSRYPGSRGSTTDYDIALIKLKPKPDGSFIKFSDHVQPACVANSSTSYTSGSRCQVSGWGSLGWTSSGHSYPRYLQGAMVPLIPGDTCARLYKHSITPRMVCAGFVEGNVDSCQGDSGGPLVCDVNGAFTLLGVVSWGHGCAKPNAPGVYTSVGNMSEWITTKQNLFS